MVVRLVTGVPEPAPHELRRDRLLELLHRHRARPLILLVAPAGFGKSTLAAAYARDSGGAAAWLTLQASDRDSRRLFTRLQAAIEDAFEEPLPALRTALDAGAEGVGLVRSLLEDLAQAPGFILVLDDFQAIGEADDVLQSIDALIRGIPEGGQLVITARESPALSMTRLLASGAVFPLGSEDLRFTSEETRALREAIGGDPSRDEQAEGWVAGILLGGAPHQLGVHGGGLLGTYVEKEVLGRLESSQREWLETLAVLDTLTPMGAERLIGAGPWPSRLMSLAGACPFLVAGQGHTYRLHGLVREALLNRLRRTDSDRWYRAWTAARQLARDTFDTAAFVRACQELGEIDDAVDLVRQAAREAMQTGRWPAVLVTLELLPEDVRRAHPDLSLGEARALLIAGRLKQAKEAAEAALHHGGRTGDVYVQVWALVELASVTMIAGEATETEDWLAAADHLLRHGDLRTDQKRLLEGRAHGVRAITADMRGRVAEARAAFEQAEHLLSLLGPSADLALAQQNFGTFLTRIGEYAAAQTALASAAAHWRVVGDRGRLANTQIVLGDMHLRLGNLEAAGEALASAQDAARNAGAARIEPWIVHALGQWHRANGRIREAVDAFDEALRLAEETSERRLLVESLVPRAELAILQEDLARARELLERAQPEAQRLGSDVEVASVDRGLGRLYLADGAGERAVSHLEAAMRRGTGAWSADEQAETLYWLGTAYLFLKRPPQVRRCLEEAISLVEQEGRPTLLAGPAAEDPALLQHGLELGLNPVVLGDIERLSATRRPWTGVKADQPLRVVITNALPRLDVQLFGTFVVHREGELAQRRARKMDRSRELLALLILNPKGLPDEAIAERMWPELPDERALHNLQMAAYQLRKDLGSKAAVRFSAKTYQLNPQIPLAADVREFESALARARAATGDQLIQALTKAVETYRDPLLGDVGWHWVEPERTEYRSQFITAALQLADLLAHADSARSDRLAEDVLAVAPWMDAAYERLISNARTRKDQATLRRLTARYEQAASRFGFNANRHLLSGT